MFICSLSVEHVPTLPSGWAVQALTASSRCPLGPSTARSWHDCHQEASGDVLEPPSNCLCGHPTGLLCTGRPGAQSLNPEPGSWPSGTPWPGPHSDRQTDRLQAMSDDLYFSEPLLEQTWSRARQLTGGGPCPPSLPTHSSEPPPSPSWGSLAGS